MNKYRYAEYYQMTEIFDNLYEKSRQNKTFNRIMDTIINDNNIKLAFRTIKTNTGSKTAGVDGITIKDIKDTDIDKYVAMVKEKLTHYIPDIVRRVFIEKPNGGQRPLGIPTMVDRLVQQSIRQVLEPICEAKFHKHNYGFRPNRSTKHAIARLNSLININGLHYVVDIDIKGFFDNVNHNKLIKQLYTIGIHDRKLISIIKAMLKAPIKGEGTPTKGTPQGGILSPLLSNIVLNELDWWISSQWETMNTRHEYTAVQPKIKALKQSKLKEMYIVRYADDFKIVCRNINHAKRIFASVKAWLKERLGLEISEEKSKIINLKKNYSEFLGIKIKVIPKGNTRNSYVAKSHIKNKAVDKIKMQLIEQVKKLQHENTAENVVRLNSMILGIQQYYKCATMAARDFRNIAFSVNKVMYNRLKKISKYGYPKTKSYVYQKFYGKSKAKTWVIGKIPINLIHCVKHTALMCFSQDICDYTMDGRAKSSKALDSITDIDVIELAKHYIKSRSIQYNDNRVSRASMCGMRCEITGIRLELETIHCHHFKPVSLGGDDEYANLRILHNDIHKLIHATTDETIDKYIHLITSTAMLQKLNKCRIACNLEPIGNAKLVLKHSNILKSKTIRNI